MKPLIRHTDEMPWDPSPMPGVERKRLELDGPAEAGRVTSVVRYAPGSRFSPHPHPDGEEILVLDGVFSDDTGDHGPGSYLLNPEGFEHAPRSAPGCTLFVKLKQYPGSRRQVRVDTHRGAWEPHASVDGATVQILYREDEHPERMHLLRLAPGTDVGPVDLPGGEEIYVIEGDLRDEHGTYRAGSWIKLAPGSHHSPATTAGCLLYVKKNHLG